MQTATQRHDDHAVREDRDMPMSAAVLGVAGVLPFVLLALAGIAGFEPRLGLPSGLARAGLVTYGVVIASFLGGVRWGVGLRHHRPGERPGLFAMAMLPPLVAWAALFMPQPHDLTVLIALFLLIGVGDVRLARSGAAPHWYATLRTVLTGLVVVVLIVALALIPLETGGY